MKKFMCRVPLFSLQKITMLTGIFAIVTMALYGVKNDLFFICCGFTISLFIVLIFNFFAVCSRYVYRKDYMKFFYLLIPYKKIYYDNYCSIVISNASYNNGYAHGPNGNILLQHKVKIGNSVKKVVYPYLSLHTKDFPFDKLKSGLTSRELLFLNSDEMCCIGVCWFDSLEELLHRTDMSIYILEDVYLRFQGEFDAIFERTNTRGRFFCVR